MYLSKRGHVYYLWYKDHSGRKQKVSTRCRQKSDALKFLQSFDQKRPQTRLKTGTLSEFRERLLSCLKSTHSTTTLLLYNRVFRHLRAMFGDIPLESLSAEHFDTYKAERLKSISPVTVNIDLRTLKAIMRTALRWRLIGENPFAGCRLVPVPEATPDYFTRDEFERLLSLVKEGWLRDILLFAVTTGLRRGEIVNLAWNHIDFQNRTLRVESSPTFQTKLGKMRVVPLSEVAMNILNARYKQSLHESVFTLNDRPIYPNWITHKLKKYLKRGRFRECLNFHSLRHTFASWLVQDGVSLYEVQKLLGHSNISVTQVYSHLQPEKLHSTVNRISLPLN